MYQHSRLTWVQSSGWCDAGSREVRLGVPQTPHSSLKIYTLQLTKQSLAGSNWGSWRTCGTDGKIDGLENGTVPDFSTDRLFTGFRPVNTADMKFIICI